MDYLLTGDPTEIAKVIQENRIRVQRGVIKFTPLSDAEAEVADVKDVPVADTKDVQTADTKTPKTAKRK